MVNRTFRIMTVAGALALAGPAFAASPAKAPAKAKVAAKPGAAVQKPADKIENIPIETDCFSTTIPGNFVPYQRVKSASRPYRGTWGFITAPDGNAKLWIRCSAAKRIPFKLAFKRSVDKMSGWVGGMKIQNISYEKDDKNRDVGVAVVSGFSKVIDPKTRKSKPASHLFVRTWVNHPDRNMRVSITIGASGKYMDKAQELMETVLKDFDIVDKADKAELKQRVARVKATVRKAATKVK